MAQDINVKITVDTTQAEKSTNDYKKRLKDLKEEMTALMVETDGLTKASEEQRKRFSELEAEASKIDDAMGDASKRVKNLSDDYRKMNVAMQGVSAGVGAFTAVSGALNMLGGDSAVVNESIQKMTSLLGVLQGVMAVQKAFDKDSQLMTALRARTMGDLNVATVKNAVVTGEASVTTEAFTVAENTANTASKGLSVGIKSVGTAIKSIPVVGWIGAAVTALLVLVDKVKGIREEQRKAYEETARQYKEAQDKINSTAAQTITKFELLSTKYSELGDNVKAKEQFLKDNKRAFDELGLSVHSVKDAEDKLINNKDAFIQAEMAKAMASAAREQAASKYAEILDNRKTLEDQKKLAESMEAVWKAQGMSEVELEKNLKSYNDGIKETESEIARLEGEAKQLFSTIELETTDGGALPTHKQEVKEIKEAYEDWDEVMDRLSKSVPNVVKKSNDFWSEDIVPADELFKDSLDKADEAEKNFLKQQEADAEKFKQIQEAKWGATKDIVASFGTFLDAAMDAELEAVKGNEEEEKEVRKKYAKAQFLQQLGGIAINTAEGIMGAWKAYAGIPYVGPALAAALSAIIGATGLAQTAAAKSAMNNALKAERGGILGGQSHANGGTMLSNGVEAERGEAIINKRSTAAFAPLLSEINSYNGYGAPLIKSNQYGGGLLNGGISDETIQRIVSATVAGVTSIPVVVSEHNITEAQRTVGITRDRAFI